MRLARNIVICLLIAASAIACSRKGSLVVATVDGTKITAQDLLEEMKMESTSYDSAILDTKANFEEFRRQALERLVQEAILVDEARRLKVAASDEELAAAPEMQAGAAAADNALSERGIDPRKWREAQRRRLMIGKLIDQEVLARIPIADERVAEYYKQHTDEFREGSQFRARQLLVDTRELAERIHSRLMKGEDFAGLAQQFSVSPDAKRGGDLGYFDAQSYPEIFSEVCQGLSIGQVSQVTATPYGYQVFQLLDRRPARQKSLAEVAPIIKRRLQEEKVEAAYQPWLDELRKKARVSINEQALKEVTLEG
ncbi:MAG: SurA N-terminal domain-containing protein [bacterium]